MFKFFALLRQPHGGIPGPFTNMQDVVDISWRLFYLAEPATVTERHMRNGRRISQTDLVGHVKEDPVLNTLVFLPVSCSFSETLA